MKNVRIAKLATRPVAALAVALVPFAEIPAAAQEPDPIVSPEPVGPPAATKPSQQVLAAWRNKVLSHLNAHKRDVSNSPGGVSTVAFSIDRSGRVLSAQILKSSGNATLDKEAVALTQRSSPVPAPPADLAGSKLYLKVPIAFTR